MFVCNCMFLLICKTNKSKSGQKVMVRDDSTLQRACLKHEKVNDEMTKSNDKLCLMGPS